MNDPETQSDQARAFGFAPIYRADSLVLVLGSMPSVRSLADAEYYAHPRNAFWPILADLLKFDGDAPCLRRCELLLQHRIAVWDVLASCRREGRLDSAIERQSEQVNDFSWLERAAPSIGHVFLNGRKAESTWRQAGRQLGLLGEMATLPSTCLPSTSPAHASMSFSQKVQSWSIVVDTLDALQAEI